MHIPNIVNELTADEERHVALWPMYPLLPIKRSLGRGGIECAIIHSSKPTRVYLVGVGDVKTLHEPSLASSHSFTDYADAAALQADGWMID